MNYTSLLALHSYPGLTSICTTLNLVPVAADVRVHAYFSQPVASSTVRMPVAPQFHLKLKSAAGLQAVRERQLQQPSCHLVQLGCFKQGSGFSRVLSLRTAASQ